ncbi:MAG: TetR/AcrR family transcriptional regulator [Vicingus serpentipes]|nr:TetR/AcrR family transcriptional regulator [Vicingus serpentipes]
MEEQEKEEQLLFATLELFMKLGVKSLTMDDISQHLGISKKTLYQFVTDKKDLVKKAMQLAIKNDQCLLGDIAVQEENAIDELLAINEKVSEKLQSIQPAVMYDLKKHYPEAWSMMEDHKKCFVYDMVVKNIDTGIQQGLYRENVNSGIVARVYITLIDKIFDADIFPAHQYTFATIHREIARYHIRGIANEKGVKYLVKRLKDNNHDF